MGFRTRAVYIMAKQPLVIYSGLLGQGCLCSQVLLSGKLRFTDIMGVRAHFSTFCFNFLPYVCDFGQTRASSKPTNRIRGLTVYEKRNFANLNHNNVTFCSGPTLELENQVSLQSFKFFISIICSFSIIEKKSKAGLNILS